MDIPTLELFSQVALIEGKIDAVNQKTSYLFNWLDFFGVDENRMSDILAFLLDPVEKHGQGSLYLNTFLELFELPPALAGGRVSVFRERGRIDVLLEIGKTAIIVENKYRGAVDQSCQIDRYVGSCLEWRKKLADIYVLYLGDGGVPSNDSLREFRDELEKGRRLKCLPFSHKCAIRDYMGPTVADFLREALLRTQSFKMRVFLEDLLNHIEGDRTLDQFETEFFNFLDAQDIRIEQAWKVHQLYERYRDARWKDFGSVLVQQIKDVASSELPPDWLCEVDAGFGRNRRMAIKLLKDAWRSTGYDVRLHPYGDYMEALHVTVGKKEGPRTASEAQVAAAVGLDCGGNLDDLSQVGFKLLDIQPPNRNDIRSILPAHQDKFIHAWAQELVGLAKKAGEEVNKLAAQRVSQL